MNRISLMAWVGSVSLAALLAGCGGSSNGNATISGTVTGLAANASVTLTDNGADAITVSSNGSFKFANTVASKASYTVAVSKQPSGQTCSVALGSGVVDYAGDNVSSVSVVCTNNALIGVMILTNPNTKVELLPGNSVTFRLTLQNDPLATYTTTANASDSSGLTYYFSNAGSNVLVPLGALYSITVATQPASQTCTVVGGNASGGVVGSSPITVDFTCQ